MAQILYGIPATYGRRTGKRIPAKFTHVLCSTHIDKKLPGRKATDYVALVDGELEANTCAACAGGRGRRCIGYFTLESARAIEKYLEARGNFTSVLPTPNAEGLHPVMSDPGTETQYQLMCKAADAIDFTVNPAGR